MAKPKFFMPVGYARLSRLNNSLRDIVRGIVELPFPKIVSCGMQSTGKSSVLSQITSLSFPRASGTCTRVPIEFRLENSDTLSCTCTIQSEKNQIPDYIDKKALKRIVSEVESIDREEAMPKTIEKAIASLQKLITADSFSRDAIVVIVKSSKVPSITLVDLPGLVTFHAQDGEEKKEAREMILEIYDKYLKDPSTVILSVITCETDIENQGIWKIVQKYDPKHERSVGVFSKADRIQEGDHEKWFGIAKGIGELGQGVKLNLGWYFTRTRTNSEIDASQQKILKIEDDYFKSGPWETFEPRQLLGCMNLLNKITHLMHGLLKKTLPNIQKEAEKRLQIVQEKLKACGRSIPDDTPGKYLALQQLVDQYLKAVKLQTGKNFVEFSKGTTYAQCRDDWDQLGLGIEATLPKLYLEEPVSASKYKVPKGFSHFLATRIVSNQQDLVHRSTTEKGKLKLTLRDPSVQYIYGQYLEEPIAYIENVEYKQRISTMIEFGRGNQMKLSIDEPDNISTVLIQEVLKQWHDPSQECIQNVYDHIHGVFLSCLSVFDQWQVLRTISGGIVEDSCQKALKKCQDLIKFHLQAEEEHIYTTNSHYLTDIKSKVSVYEVTEQEARAVLKPTKEKVSPELLKIVMDGLREKKKVENPWEQGVDACFSKLIGYCKVTYKRFIDLVMQTSFKIFFVDILNKLEQEMYKAVAQTKKCTFDELFEEDHNIAAQRQALKSSEAALKAVLDTLHREYVSLPSQTNSTS